MIAKIKVREHFGSKFQCYCFGTAVPCFYFGMAVMPSLDTLAREWDDDEDIRARLRRGQGLLLMETWEKPKDMKIDVAHAGKNYSVLYPLAKRLVADDGTVGMQALPKIKHQFLGTCFIRCYFILIHEFS